MSSPYHKILGIDTTASKAEIKKAYRAKALAIHPDINNSPEAQKLFIELAEAYDILINDKFITEKATINKYWDTYSPPTDKAEYEKWKKVDDERREFHKKKAREDVVKNKQFFDKEVKKFRNSWVFYPSLAIYYFILFAFISCPIMCLCVPIYIKLNPEDFNFRQIEFIIMSISIIILSLSSFKALKYIKKLIDPYFYGS